jgi:hypothetical protein
VRRCHVKPSYKILGILPKLPVGHEQRNSVQLLERSRPVHPNIESCSGC